MLSMGAVFGKGVAAALVFTGVVGSGWAAAADNSGNFAVRGAGLVTCELYQRERQAQSAAYLVTAAWVDGYITATNQHMADTYDVASFESTELLAEVLAAHCADHPQDRVFPVVNNLLEKLYQDRLRKRSHKQAVTADGRSVELYEETIRRVQRALAQRNFYQGPVSGRFNQDTRAAVQAFQRSVNFRDTGFPDQVTLWRLLRQEPRATASRD